MIPGMMGAGLKSIMGPNRRAQTQMQPSKSQGLGPSGSLQPRPQMGGPGANMGGGGYQSPSSLGLGQFPQMQKNPGTPGLPFGGGLSPSYGMPPMPQMNPGASGAMMGGGFRDRMTEPYGFNGEMAKPGNGGIQGPGMGYGGGMGPYQAGGLGPSADMSQAPNSQMPPSGQMQPSVAGQSQIQGPGTLPNMIKGTENEQELMGSMFNRGPMNTSMFDPRFRNIR